MSVHSKMTALADEVRELSGATEALSIDAMTTNVSEANDEILAQSALISDQDAKLAELAEILSNKASAVPILQAKVVTPTASEQTVIADSGYDGLRAVTVNGDANLISENIAEGVSIFGVEGSHSGGSGSAIETCTVTITSFNEIYLLSYSAYENNTITTKTVTDVTQHTLTNVVCGSAISFSNSYDFNGFTHSHDSKYINHATRYMWVLSAPTMPGVDATISVYDDD